MTYSNAEISEAAKQTRREYQRNYRKKNKEKVKQWNASYWERRAKRESEKKVSLNDNEKH